MFDSITETNRETAIAAAARVWEVLAQNQYRAYDCDPMDLVLDGPTPTKEWEQDAVYICKIAGIWMDTVWVLNPAGHYTRIVIRDGKAFFSDIAATSGEFSKAFCTTI